MKKLDLHMHTTVSDGTDTPSDLLLRVKEAGIGIFSITDHDAVKGCGMLREVLRDGDPVFIPGAEFSCKDEEGKYHILGYGFDPVAPAIQNLVALGHGYRMEKLHLRLDFLKETFGFTFSEEDTKALLALDNPGKPHIGNLMVRYGYAASKEEAILKYLNQSYFPTKYVRPEEAIEGILHGGGIPVLAHPSYGNGDQLIVGEKMDARLRRLIGFGLQGVEAFYSGFTPKLREEMLSFAEEYNLYVTAGSDYHGKNKMIVPGDTGMEEDAPVPEGMKKFLSAFKVEC